MPRIRDLSLYQSRLSPGPHDAITDLPGVAVGHYTLIRGEGAWRPGHGPFRTGVTLIVPHDENLYEEKVATAVLHHQWVRQAFRLSPGGGIGRAGNAYRPHRNA